MGRPAKPVDPEDHIRMCDLHVNQGLGAPRIAALMPKYHKSHVSRLLKKCPEIMNSAAGRDTIARAYSQPLAATIDPYGNSEARRLTHVNYDEKSVREHGSPSTPRSDSYAPPKSAALDHDEDEESDDYDFDLLFNDASKSTSQTPSTFNVGIINPLELFSNLVTSNYNDNIIRSVSQAAEKVNRKVFPNLYPTPKPDANTQKADEKNDESEKENVRDLGSGRACCPFTFESAPLSDAKRLQDNLSQSPIEPAPVPSDDVKFEKKIVDSDKTHVAPNQESTAEKIANPTQRPGNTLNEIESALPRDQTQSPAIGQPDLSSPGIPDTTNDKTGRLVASVLPRIPTVQQPTRVQSSESMGSIEPSITALPLADSGERVVNSTQSIVEIPPAKSVIVTRKAPEIPDSNFSTFIESSPNDPVSQTSIPNEPKDTPILVEQTSPAQDQSLNAPNPQSTFDESVCSSNAQNNTGTDRSDYLWVLPLGILAAAIGYGVYLQAKKAEIRSSTEGYARVNDPDGVTVY